MLRHRDTAKRRLAAGLGAFVAAGMFSVGALAQSVVGAVDALNAGRPAAALNEAEAVLAISPDHVDALLIKSRALLMMGEVRAAREAATLAYRRAGSDPARYAAAMIVADQLAADGRLTLSQLWLRRASEHAHGEVETAQVARAYHTVQRENPVTLTLSAGVAPNSNINNGSSAKVIEIMGLPFVLSPTARALSGVTAEASAGVRYRLHRDAVSETGIAVTGALRMNWLDAVSRRAAPGVSGHDYDLFDLGVTLDHTRLITQGVQLGLFGRAGRTWYGGAKLSDTFGAGARVTFAIGANDALSLIARADRHMIARAGMSAETRAYGGLVFAHETGRGDILSLDLGLTKSFAANPMQAFTNPEIGVSWQVEVASIGTVFTLGANAGYKDYAVSPYTLTGRQDRRLGVEASAELQDLSWMGFAPVVSVQANRTWSNVSIYDQTSVAARIGLQSRF